jgi:hypothetical protein
MSESPLAPPLSPLGRLVAAWGIVAERVAAHKETRDAVMLVLGYEQNRIPLEPRTDVPSDMAHADHCVRAGERKGLDTAALALLDPRYIDESRERLRAEIEDDQTRKEI